MREIKFRAWSKRNGYFIKQEMLSEPGFNKNDTRFINDIFKDDGYVFMQFTGLKDKNGREIYEKDVLDVQDIGYPFVPSMKGIVKFSDGSYLIENFEGTDGE